MLDEAFLNEFKKLKSVDFDGIRVDLVSLVLKHLGYTDLRLSKGNKVIIKNITKGSESMTLICAESLTSLSGVAVGKKGEKSTLVIHTDGYTYNVYDIDKGNIGEILFTIDMLNCYEDELELFSELGFYGSINSFIFNVKKRRIAHFVLMNYLNPDKESFDYIAQRLGIPNNYDFKLEVLRVLAPYTEGDKSKTKKKRVLIDTDTSAPITNVSFEIEDVLKELESNGLCFYPDSTYKTGYRLTTPATVSYGATEFEFKTWRDCVIRILQCAIMNNKVIARKLLRLRSGMTLNFFATQKEVERFCEDLNYKNGEQGIKQIGEDLYAYIWGNPTMAVTSLYSILAKSGADINALQFEYME